ncbi:MarR family winged helix-turn-helix transcriptional regulator [Bacteriovorax sp. BSW11_IV]|uniref:MarR family winged helix-turn-helix transcriptional regulator n=1 Tax=Bacteriovorax sp. BSW11_IV TaxID=1353529 RepID=UPI0018CA900B|nr:MarR family transcriptional regulator [Bacteriovorax sp. BSW11_IV]
MNKSGFYLNRTTITLRTVLQNFFNKRDIDLTPEQWAIMGLVWNFQDELKSKTLSEHFFRDKSTVSRNLKKLEDKELIQFNPSLEDSREKIIKATTKSKSIQKKVYKTINDVLEIAEEGISDKDLEITLKTLAKMDDNLSSYLKRGSNV